MLQELGSSRGSHKRELRKGMRHLVSEIYAPPRVTEEIRRGGYKYLLPGMAFDLTVNDPLDGKPWDFGIEAKRARARPIIREQKPYCPIGSPMCTFFSSWQALNAARFGTEKDIAHNKAKATMHLNFVAELYAEQVAGGRYFLHEHPEGATSWNVVHVVGDQCQYGAQIKSGMHSGDPIKKPTGVMTNSSEIAATLSMRCTGQQGQCSRAGGGAHRLCAGKRPREAAKYRRNLCRAVLRGMRNQLRKDGLLVDGCYGIQAPSDDTEV